MRFCVFNIFLSLLLLNSFIVIAQEKETGTLSGIVYIENSKEPIFAANIFKLAKEVKTGCISDQKGFYKLKLPVGKHRMKCTYIGFKDQFFEVEIVAGKSLTKNIALSNAYPEKPTIKGEPLANLEGFYKIVKIYDSDKKYKRIKKSGIQFKEELTGMGEISYNDGCNGCGSYYYRHLGEGKLEITKSLLACTLIGCKITDESLVMAFSKFQDCLKIRFKGKKKLFIENDLVHLKLKKIIN